MATRTQNILKLLHIMEQQKTVTCSQIAAELDVSLRTVHRYIADLRNAGYRFQTKIGPKGYIEFVGKKGEP